MKKFFLSTLISSAVIFSSQLFALDFSVLAESNSNFKFYENEYSSPVLKEQESLTASLRLPFNNEGNVYFVTEGFFQYTLNADINSDNSNSSDEFLADLTLFKFSSFTKKDNFDILFSAGRFFYSDLTGIVFAQENDGAFFQINNRNFTAGIYAGYTGLLNEKNVTVLDKNNSGYSLKPDSDFYSFAAPYLTGSVFFKLPYFYKSHSFAAEVSAVKGTEGPADFSPDDSRFYGTVALDGSFTPELFYIISTTFSVNENCSLGNLTSAELSLFKGKASFTASGVFASGNKGSLSAFNGFTSSTAVYSASEMQYSSLIKGGLSLSYKLLDNLVLLASGDGVFDFGDETGFSGVQAGASCYFQLLSDVAISLDGTTFVSNKSSDENLTSVTFKVALAF